VTEHSIVISGISKVFKRYNSPWGRIVEWLTNIQRHEPVIALNAISLTVPRGVALGLLGVNGAGKSTLLKIIAGVVAPSAGEVHVAGRVAALLELGLGFHQDFTGRQNITIAAQMMGFSVYETQQALPDIEHFAAIGDYIDQPVRTYSSGMQMRLAFSVATAIRPDVLIVDEALSVGDAAFQRKCFRRIAEFQAQGTSLLFVSHDTEVIKKLCSAAVLIHDGGILSEGLAAKVCDDYENLLFGDRSKIAIQNAEIKRSLSNNGKDNEALAARAAVQLSDPNMPMVEAKQYGSGEVSIDKVWLQSTSNTPINTVGSGGEFQWCFTLTANSDVEHPVFSMMIKTVEGVAIFGTDSAQFPNIPKRLVATSCHTVSFSLHANLAPGYYFMNCGVRMDKPSGTRFVARHVDCGVLRVISNTDTTALIGSAELSAQLSVTSEPNN